MAYQLINANVLQFIIWVFHTDWKPVYAAWTAWNEMKKV